MMAGETILTGGLRRCSNCKVDPKPQVLMTNGNIYIGTKCHGQPFTRESEYYKDFESAEKDLKKYEAALDGKGPMPETARRAGLQPGGLKVEAYDESKGDLIDWMRGN